ncbi:MAG: cytochrome c oxidase assembly protein [Alphaproteobacteria bacterium]|nr:cytochrome c oxidase assembly protein [Alphaproteobacteria bacterium]
MDVRQKNKRVLLATLGVAFGMVALSFASVPLYRTLCQVTGWGGTTQRAAKNTSHVYNREFVVQFNADVDRHLPWAFRPDMRQVKVKVGADAIISYFAENHGKLPISGSAVYNVTPLLAGKYFNKTQCFCFAEQILQPGQKVHMPVTFFVDPKIMEDRELKDLKTITLSYTFYRHDSKELEKAVENFYNASDNPHKKTN